MRISGRSRALCRTGRLWTNRARSSWAHALHRVLDGGHDQAPQSWPSRVPRGRRGGPHSPLLLAFGSLYAMVVPIVTALLPSGSACRSGLLSAWILTRDLRAGRRGDDRARCRDRLRAADRDPAPGGMIGHDPRESPTTVGTAGRSVLVAGSTVMVALLSLFLIGIPFVSALGLA